MQSTPSKKRGSVQIVDISGVSHIYTSYDGSPEANGVALASALGDLSTGDTLILDEGQQYSLTDTAITGVHDVTIFGKNAKIVPKDSPWSALIKLNACHRWNIFHIDFDGLSRNYDSFELSPGDPGYSIEAKVVSYNQNLSPQGDQDGEGARFIFFASCCDMLVDGIYAQGNSCQVSINSLGFESMWTSDALFFYGGQRNTVRNSYFYRCGYSGIRAQCDDMHIENCTVHNCMWHAIVANSITPGHSIYLKNVEFKKEGTYHLPAPSDFDLNANDDAWYDVCSLDNVTFKISGYLPGGKAWAAGQTVVAGDYRYANSKWYRAAGPGTTGGTAPSHSTGTASDGSITWAYVSPFSGINAGKGGPVHTMILNNVTVDMDYSAEGGIARAFAVQDDCDTLQVSNCWFSHQLQHLGVNNPFKKVSITNTTVGATQPEAIGIYFDALDLSIDNSVIHFTTAGISMTDTTANHRFKLTNNIFIPEQTANCNMLLMSKFENALKAGNALISNNIILDKFTSNIYDTHFTSVSGYYNRMSETAEGRLLMRQNPDGKILWDPVNQTGGTNGVPAAGTSSNWFPGLSGWRGAEIINLDYDVAGGDAWSPFTGWTWQGSKWVAKTGAPRKDLSDDLGAKSGSVAIDLDSGEGDVKVISVTGDISSLTFTGDRTGEYFLLFEQDPTGHNVTFSNLYNSPPTVSATADSTTLIRIYRDPSGKFFGTGY